jgi:phospholipid/cholesterol/gamma-HCH transport system ATP-binding protein
VEFTLEVAGLAEHRHRYPAALAAVTIRKAALARALVLGPRLLLCDDVFAGLDPKAQNQINDYLRALHILGSMTTVILTHNLRMAFRLATRVAVLAEGRIVTSGPPDDIRRSALPEVMNLLQDDGAID